MIDNHLVNVGNASERAYTTRYGTSFEGHDFVQPGEIMTFKRFEVRGLH